MSSSFNLWLEYLIRFSHLVTGIMWIGSSFYFIWQDSSFEVPETPERNVEGEVFMVHGGFYYKVQKRKIYPGELPKILHWFKWEATFTWITGFLLLIVVYYLKGASLLIDPSIRAMTQAQAVGLSLATLVSSWLIYDLLIWNPRGFIPKWVSSALSAVFFAGLIYWMTRFFSGRGAFIMTGAILGSMMLLNVWIRILPGQAKMLREATAGQVPDYSVSLKSKTRSVHNTYFTFPVLFIMLSNHYPTLYNHSWNWLILIILGVSGALVRHAMVTKNKIERWTIAPAVLGILSLIAVTAQTQQSIATSTVAVPFEKVYTIVQNRCHQCHSMSPTDEVFKTAPNGVVFQTESDLRRVAEKIQLHVVTAKSMPLANKTQMTDEERSVIASWLKQQSLVH